MTFLSPTRLSFSAYPVDVLALEIPVISYSASLALAKLRGGSEIPGAETIPAAGPMADGWSDNPPAPPEARDELSC
jgi:hypothetical protein